MIEQMTVSERVDVARCHRRLANSIIVFAVTVVLLLVVNVSAVGSWAFVPEMVAIGILWLSQFAWLLLLLLWGAIFVYAGYFSVRAVENSLISLVLLAACFVPIVQVLVGIAFCWTLRAQWRRHGIEASWRGLSRATLDELMSTDHCRACGYDLTGNVSGVCPECGTIMKRELA